MGRIEYKYLVPQKLLPEIRQYFSSYLVLDQYAAVRAAHEYTVRSLYYDTVRYDFYHEKVEGIRKRKKLRIRAYNEFEKDTNVFLEIKRKNGQTISKTRSAISHYHFPDLLETGDVKKYISESNGNGGVFENARRFLFHIKNLALKPVILILYEREAYFYKFNRDLRITFDKNLRSKIHRSVTSIFEDDHFARALPGYFILEIKTKLNFPPWLNYLIAASELRQQALSKYTMCLDRQKKNGFHLNRIFSSQVQIGAGLNLMKTGAPK